MRTIVCVLAVVTVAPLCTAGITPIDIDAMTANGDSYFYSFPTQNPALCFGFDPGANGRGVNFNTAPDGPLSEGLELTNQYESFGVLMNSIRISASIYGGNNYGPGFAAEDDAAHVYTFITPVVAVGIVNTSPDRDLVQFWSGPNATGTLLFEFRDTEGLPLNFNVDRFVGGIADAGTTIGSFVVSNQSGNLELDELIFVVPVPSAAGPGLLAIGFGAARRRR